MNKIKNIIFLSFVLIGFSSNAQEIKIEQKSIQYYAQNVFNHYLSLKEPVTNLEKWQKDMWMFSSRECIQKANMVMPEILKKAKVYKSGSYAFSNDIYSTCKSLSSGPYISCFNLKPYSDSFGMPLSGLMTDYVYIENGKKVQDNEKVAVSGYCHLTKEYIGKDKQFFTGNGTFHWTQHLKSMSINTAQGTRNIVGGNANVVVEGLPGNFPFLVIQK